MDTDEIAWDTLLAHHDSDDAFVAIVDSDFVLRAASPATGGKLEIDPADVIGTSAADLIHPDDMLRAPSTSSRGRRRATAADRRTFTGSEPAPPALTAASR